MAVTFGNLEIVDIEGRDVYRCLKCGYVLCSIEEDYKNSAFYVVSLVMLRVFTSYTSCRRGENPL